MSTMRKGSLEFWPHRRAKKQMPRVRTWRNASEPSFSGFVAFKAGMTHVKMIDDSEAPSKGSEVSKPVTILEVPKVYVYGIRLYKKDVYKEPGPVVYSKELAKEVGIKNTKNTSEKLSEIKKNIDSFTDATALLFLNASNLGFGNKRVMRFEIGVGGRNINEKVEFAEKWLGKELKVSDVFKDGEYIDTTSISKGRGWAGVIKRFRVSRQMRKATGKIRHVGTLGPWHPPKVTYMVPHSGHMGYNYRTEINKRVLKVGGAEDAKSVNVAGGFLNYGVIKNDFMIVEGSIAGTSKRLIRLRKAIRNKAAVKKPDIKYVSISSKQGA